MSLPIANLIILPPSVTESSWQTYSSGTMEIVPEDSQVAFPYVTSTEWTGQTRSSYDIGIESTEILPPWPYSSPVWVQYAIVTYSYFNRDAAQVSVPSLTNVTWG